MKISIITVSYNSEKTIEDTIKSVYFQNYDDIEYIIIDGGSKDETINIIKKYDSLYKMTNKTYKWISQKDNGIYDAINKGISMSTGEIVGILNSDDYFYDNEVVMDINKVFSSKDIDCVYGNLIYINSNTGKICRKWISNDFVDGSFRKSWTPAHPTFYCRKSLYIDFGQYKTNYKIAADVELMFRLLQKNHVKSFYLDRYFVKMRQGGVSSSGIKSTIVISKEVSRAFHENGEKLNLIIYLFFKVLKFKEKLFRKI